MTQNHVQPVTAAPVDIVAALVLELGVPWGAQNISVRATIYWKWADAAPPADDNAGRIRPGESLDFTLPTSGGPLKLWVWTDEATGRLFVYRGNLWR